MIYLAVGDVEVREKELNTIKDLQRQFNDRPIWMAASVHRGEEEVILRVHGELIKAYPSLLLILVPRHPQDIKNVSLALKKHKVNFVLRSTMELVSINTRVYVVDTLENMMESRGIKNALQGHSNSSCGRLIFT
uniref:Lipid IV(A) 3-deoxy-D-manno-octulosonic acid transferase n=1 Tax=Aegilops tauschii subsp. strangulata TaxID=200361 RepID=A0A453FYM4_AEGTS